MPEITITNIRNVAVNGSPVGALVNAFQESNDPVAVQVALESFFDSLDSAHAEALKAKDAEIARLRGGIKNFLDGDYGPKIKKIDKCQHGQYGYESCEACIDQHFFKLLNPDQAK